MPRLILASSSPRRNVLLKSLVDDFDVEHIPVEEVAPRALSTGDAVEVIARKKALAVSTKRPQDWVLAADTVVVFGTELVNKAYDEQTERRQLTMLMGGTHQVWTGLALAWNGKALDHRQAVTAVQLDRLPVAVLDAYVASGQWQGKAGGYGIQDRMLAPFLRVMSGPWSNVVGLPLAKTAELLRANGVATKDPPAEDWLAANNPF
ncbi:MAG: Maf family protein [Candidatus Thermoplasmatota archaeon]